MTYRKETFHSQLKGVNEFTSRLEPLSDVSGQNWWYVNDRQIAQRPGSLSIDNILPDNGYCGLVSFHPASPIIANTPIVSVSATPVYTYSTGNSNLKYVVPTLLALSKTKGLYRVRKYEGIIADSSSGTDWVTQNVDGHYTLVLNRSTGIRTIINLHDYTSLNLVFSPLSGELFLGGSVLNAGSGSSLSIVERTAQKADSLLVGGVIENYFIDLVPLSLLNFNTVPTANIEKYTKYTMTYRTGGFTAIPADTNSTGINFNGLCYFAGDNQPLTVYDGARASIAGAPPLAYGNDKVYTTALSSGSLTGSYTYKLRPKIYRPNGSVAYGRETTISVSPSSQQVVFDKVAAATYPIYMTINRVVPRRNTLLRATGPITVSGSFFINFADYNMATYTGLQPGEVLFFSPVPNGCQQVLQVKTIQTTDTLYRATLATEGTNLPTLVAGDIFSLGESVEIYRNTASGSTWYMVAEIPYGATYTDNLSDASLSTNQSYVELGYDPGPPPEYTTCVATHQNRLCVTTGYATVFPSYSAVGEFDYTVDTLAYSQPNTDEFPAENSLVFSLDTDDRGLTSTFSQDDMLYVASERSMWLIQGDLSSAEAFSVEKLATKTGIVSNTGFGAINGQMMALGIDGVFTLSGRSIDRSVGYPVQETIRQLPYESIRRASVVVYKNYWILAIPGVGQYKTNLTDASPGRKFLENKKSSLWLIYDLARDCWYKWTNLPSSGVTIYDDFIWCVGRDNVSGITRLTDLMPNDTLAAIDMQFKSNWHGNETAGQTKHFARTQIIAAGSESQNFTLRVRTESNWIENIYDQDTIISFKDGEGYAESPYATIEYGDANITEQLVPISKPKAKAMRLTLSNNVVAEKPIISGWTIELNDNTDNVKDM